MNPVDKNLGLTVERLRSCLSYDSETGNFIWKCKSHKSMSPKIGDIAGSVDSTGYIRIWIDGKRYVGHRLAWFYVHGSWPKEQIDHIDGNKKNNRLRNLREVTPGQNCANTKVAKTTITGLRGVTKQGNKYRARIQRSGKMMSLGLFNTASEALVVYNSVKIKYGEVLPVSRRDE